MFFSALAFYFAITLKKDNQKDLLLVVLAFAIAVATKVSALMIAPAIFLIIADRYEWQINKKNLIVIFKFSLIFLVLFLILSQFNYANVIRQIKTTQNVSLATLLSYPSYYSLFSYGIASATLYSGTILLLACGILVQPILKIKYANIRQNDFFYVFFTLALAAIYLIFTVKQGYSYIAAYFSVVAVAFLMPLGVLSLDSVNRTAKYSCGFIILVFNLMLNMSYILKPYDNDYSQIGWGKYYAKSKDIAIMQDLATQKKLKNILTDLNCDVHNLSTIRDYKTMPVYSAFTANASIRESIVFENWPIIADQKGPFEQWDIVGFYKPGEVFLPDDQFKVFIKSLPEKIAIGCQENRMFVQNFFKNMKINGSSYTMLLDNERVTFFASNKFLSNCSERS